MLCVWEPHKTTRLPSSQVTEAYIPARAKEKGAGAWGFKEEEGSSREAGKSRCLGTNVCHAV